MLASPDFMENLLARWQGKLRKDAELANINWFRVGGKADFLFRPENRDDLCAFLKEAGDLPRFVMGVGSNLIIRDGGMEGVVIRLGRGFAEIKVEDGKVRAGAAALCQNVARVAAEAGIAGLEFLVGIPGTVGGALAMNAGAYGAETKDILVEAEMVDGAGNVQVRKPQEMGYRYRGCELPQGWVFTGGLFQGAAGDAANILARMEEITRERSATQPVKSRTGGSTFKNPEGQKAWQVIDRAGMRGATLGGAQVSELHCNFLINQGGATAADLEGLGERVREKVKETQGIALEWEIKRVGRK
ncbi:MAG: UDP-N-acetylmuramate dehydrogenase [Alphaproteobacteria bacterium]|nr:UDP-N-acetylmuramate dehydrogenase [Alphaproteobacteria bacterium]